MDFLKKMLDIFKPEKLTNEGLITNEGLLKELSSHFKTMLKSESVGQRMLYPMSFNILMTPEDYESRKQSLPFVLPQVVAGFYKIIKEMRVKYPDYTPPAKYWFFQFSACQVGEVQSNNTASLIVRKGHIATVANLLTFDIKEANNVFADTNTRMSIKLDDSNVMNDVNVNWNAIKSLDIIGDGTFCYNFDNNLGGDIQRVTDYSSVTDMGGLAELTYSRGGRNLHYIMKDNLIHISGRSEKRSGRAFFILEEHDIKDSHVQIKYLPSDKRFQIAAFGPTRLNSRKLVESSGGDLIWHDLANNSSIFINDEISIKFEIK